MFSEITDLERQKIAKENDDSYGGDSDSNSSD